MSLNNPLFLYEEIMLLSLRDREGTIEPMVSYREALGGSILAELLLEQYVEIDQSKRSKPIQILKNGPVDDELLNECLGKIVAVKRRKTAQEWVMRFANIKNLKHRIAGNLCQKGILSESEDKVMLFFTRKIYPEVNPGPEREILDRINQAIAAETDTVDARTTVLISLAYHTGLLKRITGKDVMKSRKKRIKEIISGEAAGQAAAEAIQALQAAVMVAAIMPAIAAASASS